MWKKRKILTAISIIHLQPILKEKREGAPEWNFYKLRKWIMGRVTWIKTDQFLWWGRVFLLRQFLGEKQKQRKGGKGTKGEAQKERERKGEWRREGGKWCSKKPASTLDRNLKVPGSTLMEIIHPKTTIKESFL